MTDDQHGQGMPQGGGRWDPLPQGDYDDGATAFVQLPEGGVDALLASADSPLAAPGHGYVPPPITVTPATTAGTDPAATGTWVMPSAPVDGTQWQAPPDAGEPHAGPHHAGYAQHDPYGAAAPYGTDAGQDDRFTYHPQPTGQWDFTEATAADDTAPAPAPAPGHDVTGQWSIPVAGGDIPDESGEFTTSSLVEQWGGTPPATLPGGAPAPWATQAAGQPWGEPAHEPAAHEPAGQGDDRPAGHEPAGQSDDRPAGHAPAPSAGPYAEAPAEASESVAETPPAAPTPDGTVTDEAEEAAEAPESAAEPPAGLTPDTATESAPEAAEEPVTASGAEPGPAPDARPEPTPDRSPAQPAPATAHEPEAAASGEPAAEPAEAPESGEPQEPAAPGEPAPAGPHEEHPLASYVLRVNGTDRPVTDAWIGESLLYVLRERLGLAGAKDGCSQGECGACNVQVDGRLVASCLVPAVTAAGSEVRTVEGLAVDGQPSDVQRALARCGAVQCGFCVPGMAMTVHNLLEGNPAPTELETRQALCGNLCRCSGYRGVLEAVKEVVAEREAHAAADAPQADADEPRIPHQAGPGAGGVNPSAFEAQGPPGPQSPGPHDQPYGQDGGHA
ncbi:2Fe-2S iron-sulfur cluster-binding protein [Streptomyces sp. NPDC052309]|uniref:2Fe-2S iron-sulfur cluster-binding protein n=1 Tax=Streptomyces sp. NPDC052309 TaxID=3155421 RepID=UPI003427D937